MRTAFLALTLLIACADSPADGLALRGGGFHYSAFGDSGQPLLTGRLNFSFPDDSTLNGTWSIAWIPGADTTLHVGPQVGSGAMVGSRRGDTLLIQLNPTFADNNVGLVAVPTADGYSGQWSWSTFAGPTAGGRFSAAPE